MDTNHQISEDQIVEIRKNVDIVDIISNYIPLTAKGKNFFGVCPFHADHSPSMSVNRDKQIYKCFSCGAAGNVFKFIMDYEHISFAESLKILADKAGIEININTQKKDTNKFKELYEIYETAQKFYQNNINTEIGKKAKEYLHKRNISNDIIKQFEIGLSLKDNKLLTNMLINKKYDKKILLNSGLINENEKGLHDIYYNRIMFPLYDSTGKIVGYSGRIYDNNDSSKYINTKETPIFKKGELLYNYHKAKDTARLKNQIIVVEGFMDVIGLFKVGIKNVVATMGTAVTKEQAMLIKRLAKEVILCFDGDDAGAHATQSCINELNKLGVVPKIVRLEDNLDPDEYVNLYNEKIKIKIDNPISIIDFKMQYLKKDKNLNDNIEYSDYINQVLKEVSVIDDSILIELTLQKLSSDTNIDIEILRKKIDEFVQDKKEIKKIEIIEPVRNINNKYEKAEKYLLYYMLNNKDVVTIFNNNKVHLPTEKYRTLAREVVAIYKEKKDINIADIMTLLNNQENHIKTINDLLNLDLKDEYNKEEILDYIKTITIYNIKEEKNKLKKLMSMEIEPSKKAEYGIKLTELKLQEQEIMKEGI
ncbi:MAG: DNA primase [Bacilli bacterium]|nr:DNA primase [Bacilli bacterium]